MLTLPEELILLALDEEKGTVGSSSTTRTTITYGLTTAIIMELVLAGRVSVERPERKFLVLRPPHGKIVVTDPTLTGDEILDDALMRIQKLGKVKGPFYWIDKLGKVTVARDAPQIDWSGKGSRFLERLTMQGLIYRKEHKTLGVFESPRFHCLDVETRQQLKDRLDRSLFTEPASERRQVMLIGLARACHLLDSLYPDYKRRREALSRAREIQKTDDGTDFLVGEISKVRAAHDTVTIS